MAGNPDFELIVGVDAGASFDAMKSGLEAVINRLNSDPQKVKLEFDLKSGLDGFKDFQKQIVDGMTGLGSVLRFNMEQINDIGKMLNEISKKDFGSVFDFSGMFAQSNKDKLAEYKVAVSDYIKYVDNAFKTLSSTGSTYQRGTGTFLRSTDLNALEELRAKIGQFASMPSLEAKAAEAQAFVQKYIAAFRAMSENGVEGINLDKLLTIPEKPLTAANQAQAAFTQLGEVLQQIKQAMSSEASGVDDSSAKYDAHQAAVQAAVDAEKLKASASRDVRKNLNAEADASEKSAQASEDDAKASEKAAKAKNKAKKASEQTDEEYYADANKLMEEYYAKEERKAAEAAEKKKHQEDMAWATKRAQEAAEEAKIEERSRRELVIMEQEAQKQADLYAKLSSPATLDELGAKLESARVKMEALGSTTGSMDANFQKLQSALAVLSNPDASLEDKIQANKEFGETLKALTAQIKAAEDAERARTKTSRETAREEKEQRKNLNAVKDMLNEVHNLQKKVGADTTTGQGLSELEQELVQLAASGEVSSDKVDELRQRFKALRSEAKGLGEIKSPFDALEDRMLHAVSLVALVTKAIAQIKSMVRETVTLDTAMTQLRIVTDNSEDEYKAYGESVVETAKTLGAAVSDLVDSTTVYARLGYTLGESSELARVTAMLKNVGDIDISSAQDAVTVMTKAFSDVDASNIESVMDKLVVVGNSFPVSVSQLADGINNAGSALSASGNSFEQAIALLTAANTATQDINKASTGLRTIAARIRKTTVELDDLGEVIEEAKYQEVLDLLSGKGVKLTENGEYRATYDILQDIAGVWNSLSTMEHAAIAEQLAGKLLSCPCAWRHAA